jgi:mevalonate kinase
MVQYSYGRRNFPAKVLLFGEYGIVTGGSGMAIPYQGFSGQLEIGSGSPGFQPNLQSNHSVSIFATYLRNQKSDFKFLDLQRFSNDVSDGIWFNSDIPNGYGLGSSGALVAAIYSRYRLDTTEDTAFTRDHLARMESYFHGSSSGIDPSVSFFDKAIVVGETGISVLTDWSTSTIGLSVFLVDTGISAKTIQLVDWFKSKMIQSEFRHRTEEDFLKVNHTIIEKLQQGEALSISDLFTISYYQLEYLVPMVPDSFRLHIIAGLKSREFAFKLCGSGGGGYMLCFAANRNTAIDYFNKTKLSYIEVE